MIEVRTPSRLHFGLLAFDRAQPRQFGGVGLMIRRPDTIVRLSASDAFTGEGRMNDRAVAFAQRFLEKAAERGIGRDLNGVHVQVLRIPRPHTGLGTGTQLGLAVARGLAKLLDIPDMSLAKLAHLVGRGQRSAIGAHGFIHGGFIVEGGKRDRADLSPMLLRLDFPEAWRVVLIRPHQLEGLCGEREQAAFDTVITIPRDTTAELCRLVLLGLAPAVIEHDIDAFGEALFTMQQLVGQCFAASQGGIYADPLLEKIVTHLRDGGVAGVGQSSWGPSLYAVVADQTQAEQVADDLRETFGFTGQEILITEADNDGGAACEVAVDTEGTALPVTEKNS